ncbi:MAG: twin-arginine translocase subunit TatC [Gaiellaceae bacterium]
MNLPRRLAHDQEATLVGHLEELRSRLMVAGGAVLVGTTVAYLFHHRLVHWITQPLPVGHRQLLTLGVAEPFTTSLKISVAAGFALALPVVLAQVWGFFAPALEPRVQRSVRVLTAFAGGLLVAGVAFGYRIALPSALDFLVHYDRSLYHVQIRAADYLSFALLVLAACAAVFELPIVVLGLVRVGALTSAKLRRNRRVGYLVVAAIGVALPGVDPVTTIFETIPLALLFEGSIWLAVVLEARWRPATVLGSEG